MTGDQQPDDLLDLPFDQYQRYRIVSEVLRLLGQHQVFGGGPVSILDVGGYPGLLQRFVPLEGARTIVLDVVPDTESASRYNYTYLMGSGMELPFPDQSFSCVVSLDTLEHIPAEARPAFLSEMQRVGRDAAIFIGPVHREETALSEELLFDYIQWLLKAKQEQLAEHRGYGLPDLLAVNRSFDQAGWTTHSFPAGNLYNWLFMMVAKHYLISFRDEQAAEFERKLDHFYNLMFSENDRQEPAYRGIMVATRESHPLAFGSIAERYPSIPASSGQNLERLELAQLLMRLFDLKVANHEDKALREQMEHRESHISGLEQRVALLDRDLDSRRRDLEQAHQHAANLEEAISAGQQHAANLQKTITAGEQHIRNLQKLIDDPDTGMAALQESVKGLTVEINYLRDEYHKHLNMIKDLQREVEQKNEHILYLEQLLQKIESGTALRVTRNISRIFK